MVSHKSHKNPIISRFCDHWLSICSHSNPIAYFLGAICIPLPCWTKFNILICCENFVGKQNFEWNLQVIFMRAENICLIFSHIFSMMTSWHGHTFFFVGIWEGNPTNIDGFLAATKQLYEWFSPSVRLSVRLSVCPSVRLSVTPFWLCSHHPIIMKFSGVITSDKSDVHAKGQGQRSKVKVTEVTTQIFVSGL